MSGYVRRSLVGRWAFRLRNALTFCPYCQQRLTAKAWRLTLTWSDGTQESICRFCAYQQYPDAVVWAETELAERGIEP